MAKSTRHKRVVTQNLKTIRTSKGLSIDELASKSGLPRDQIEALEARRLRLDAPTMVKLGRALGVPGYELLFA